MTKIENKDMLNAIRSESSVEYQNNIPMATGSNDLDVFRALETYPTAKNEFIGTLTNRIGKQIFFDKVFNNPYKMLHKGELPYGKTVEEMFVEMAEEKGFNDHFTGSSTNEGDLIGLVKPKVRVDYITQNFAYKFKTSISNQQIRGAFNDRFGLFELINRAVNSLLSASEYAEFRDMKKILTHETKDLVGGSSIDKGMVQRFYEEERTKINAIIPLGAAVTGTNLAKNVRMYSNKLTFPSNNYNLANVKTWTNKNDLVLFTTPEMQAEIDVNVLAFAFNVSSADVNVRTILVDDLGATKEKAGNKIVAILADKDLIQAYDTINETSTFYNGERLATNYFAHKHGIMAGCTFANAVIFVEGESVL